MNWSSLHGLLQVLEQWHMVPQQVNMINVDVANYSTK